MRHSILFILAMACGCTLPDYPKTGDDCDKMCVHGRDDLGGCEFSKPAESGAACEDICRNSRNNGRVWDAQCILDATSCTVADEC